MRDQINFIIKRLDNAGRFLEQSQNYDFPKQRDMVKAEIGWAEEQMEQAKRDLESLRDCYHV